VSGASGLGALGWVTLSGTAVNPSLGARAMTSCHRASLKESPIPEPEQNQGSARASKKEKLSLGAEKRPPDLPGRSRGPGTSDAVSSAGVTERVTRRQSRCVFRGARLSGRPARPISLEGWGVGEPFRETRRQEAAASAPRDGFTAVPERFPHSSAQHITISPETEARKKCNSPKNIRP
jgi:hypothetical protein